MIANSLLTKVSFHRCLFVLCRFLQVHPASVEDERLLVAIVKFLNSYFRDIHTEPASAPEDKDLRWILELLLNQVHIYLLNK